MYSVYGSQICHNRKEFWEGIKSSTRADWAVIRREPIEKKEKIYWAVYALRRNIIRYRAGAKAVEYFHVSKEEQEKMDRKYSQQLRMRSN